MNKKYVFRLEDELMNWLEDLGTEDTPIDRTELNDYIAFQSEDIYDALGLDENGDPLDESKKIEARSHKEDNEKASPRFITTKNGNKKRARNMVDVTNPKVGNKSYHNEKGNQYWGTTEDEYASKRNKTGQKNDNGTEQYLADYDDMQNPVKKFQYLKGQAKSRSDDAEQLKKIGSRVRAQWKKDYYNQGIKSAQAQADRQNAEATDIVNQERERIANKQKNTESKNTSKLSVKIVLDENKKEKAKRNIIPKNHKLNEGYSMENFRISGNICNIISFDSIDIQEKKYDENYDEYYDINAKCNIIAEIQDLELDYGPHKAYIDKFNPKIKITELETYGTIDNEDFKDKGRLEQIIAEDIYGTSFSELINISIYPGYKGEPIQAELYKADIVGYIKFEFIEQPVIDYINFKWDDENDINYRLVDENGDIIEELGDRKDAINLAEKTPKCVAVIEVYYDWYLTDGEGSEDSDYCEDGRTVWTREKKTEGLKGNTIPRNWKKITYKSKIDTNLNKAGDTLEVERDEWDRPIVKNTSTGEAGRLNWDIIRNPELAEIINIEKKTEARNPENDEINTKIRKSLNGSTKYKDDLKKAGLEVSQNEKGKVTAINDMDKEDLKNSHPDTDYYNYLTKQKVQPEVTDTGAFSPTNPFRNSDNFENTISKEDRTVYKSDNNGVSKAIPKKYKTGRKNFGYNPDEFPRKNYNGVASYEPLEDKELKDFKYAKSTTSDGGWKKQDLNRAKAEYDRAKAEYDKDANKVNSIRDRIAKSKANRKAETRSHKEDRKITEATTDVNEVVDEYKEAYHKDLDLKTVPCVIARDKMLSGWGGAEGKNHYQVVLCADSTEAHNIANNMQAQAKREQLANVRVSFGVKLPSRASVAYCVGRYASAWNMGDSWYERYDTEKKTESKE